MRSSADLGAPRRASADRGRPRAARRFLVPALLLAAASLAAVGALGVSRLGRLQERRRQELEAAGEAAAELLGAARELAARHPELDLGPLPERVQSLAAASPERRLTGLGEAQEAFAAVELGLLEELTGLGPQDERWAEARRYRSYSPAGFKDLQDRTVYPDAQPIAAPPPVTGQEAADRRIVSLAEGRGYRLRWQVDEAALAASGAGPSLHAGALDAWRRLREAAAAEGVQMQLVSGYRPVGRQRTLFLSQLQAAGEQALGRPYRPDEIAAGQADAAILSILSHSSIPGYSKHHSGCALDLTDPSSGLDFTEFARTAAYAWLSRHNYLNAKRFGFVPSYPPGAPAQGPDPEPWEFLWVGEEPLRRLPPVVEAGGADR